MAGLIGNYMIPTFTSIGYKELLDGGLTSSSRMIVPFATSYINNITGGGDNHIFGFAFSVDQNSEYQIAYGIVSKKWYQRHKSYTSSTWGSWTVVS